MTLASASAIRPATQDDAAAIAAVQIATWQATYKGIVPQHALDAMNSTKMVERWQTVLDTPRSRTFVVHNDGENPQNNQDVFGFISGGPLREPLAEFDAELYALYLLPNRHRQGIGRACVRHLASALENDGYRNMVAWVLAGNPAVAFYKSLGAAAVTGKMIVMGGASIPELAFAWPSLRPLLQL